MNHDYGFYTLIENKNQTFDYNFTWKIKYNSNCSWFKIIVGPCDNTNSEATIINYYEYNYKPYGDWEKIRLYFDSSKYYE